MGHEQHAHTGKKAAVIGFLAGAATAVAVGAAFSRKGKTRAGLRLESWALRAKADILEKMAEAEDMGEREYKTLVDLITSRYATMHDIAEEKAGEIADELKKRWKEMRENAKETEEDEEDI